MNKLKKYKFSELYEMSSGISSTPEQAGHGAQFCSFTTVFNNYFLPEELPDKMDTSPEEQETYSIQTGDILLTRTSETLDELGMSCVATKDYPKATFSGFLKRLRPLHDDLSYHKFMAFYLRSPMFRKSMNNNAVMTLRCSLNEQIFSYLDLLLPSYEEQTQIGDLLYSIYSKTELNHRINQELEGLAKLLYDYWFLQFDFPISAEQAVEMGDPTLEGKPYRQSGGKMTYDPTLKRKIPEGWGVQLISNFIASDKAGDWGQDSPSGNYQTEVLCIRGTDLNSLNGIGQTNPPTRFILNNNSFKILKPNDVIIEISGGSTNQSTGRVSALTEAVFSRFDHPLICSNFCKALSLKKEAGVHYFYRTWKRFYDAGVLFNWEGKTSGIKNLLFDSFTNHHHVVKPDVETLAKFESTLEQFEKLKQINLQESQELVSLRDWLLPMLMNGQITVRSPRNSP